MEVAYKVAKDVPGMLVKMEEDLDGTHFYMFDPKDKVWLERDYVCGYFVGFDPATPITEEEAKSYM